MRISRLGTGGALALSAAAQGQWVTPFDRVVEHGRSLKLGSYGSFDPACRPIGRTVIDLTSAPQGGQVEAGYGLGYPAYTDTDVRFQCDERRRPEAILYSRASPNSTGTDTVDVEIVFGGGEARQGRYSVSVR